MYLVRSSIFGLNENKNGDMFVLIIYALILKERHLYTTAPPPPLKITFIEFCDLTSE